MSSSLVASLESVDVDDASHQRRPLVGIKIQRRPSTASLSTRFSDDQPPASIPIPPGAVSEDERILSAIKRPSSEVELQREVGAPSSHELRFRRGLSRSPAIALATKRSLALADRPISPLPTKRPRSISGKTSPTPAQPMFGPSDPDLEESPYRISDQAWDDAFLHQVHPSVRQPRPRLIARAECVRNTLASHQNSQSSPPSIELPAISKRRDSLLRQPRGLASVPSTHRLPSSPPPVKALNATRDLESVPLQCRRASLPSSDVRDFDTPLPNRVRTTRRPVFGSMAPVGWSRPSPLPPHDSTHPGSTSTPRLLHADAEADDQRLGPSQEDSDHDEDDEDIPDLHRTNDQDMVRQDMTERTAEYVLDLFKLQHIGCSDPRHDELAVEACEAHEGLPCHGLADTFSDRPFIRPTEGIKNIGLHSPSFPEPFEVNRNRFPPDDVLRVQFEGTSTPDRHPRHICLHSDHYEGAGPQVEYDFDALLVFMNSFDGFRLDRHLRLCFTKQTRYNISSGLHITLPVPIGKGTQAKHIKEIPHLYLGSLDGLEHSTIFALFPRLYNEDSKSSWLTDKHAQQFLDIWLAACRRHVSVFIRQYLPPDSTSAEGRATAKGVEHQSVKWESRFKQLKTFPVPVDAIQRAWTDIEQQIRWDRTGLGVFGGATIFVNAKNTKLDLPAPTLLGAVERFHDAMEDAFHTELIEYFADLGVKIVPPPRRSAPGVAEDVSDDSGSECETAPISFTYLWKTCCLDGLYEKIRREAFDGVAGRRQKYTNGYLRDATNLTLEPPATSWIRKGGLLYLQGYNSCKEIEDAQQVRPFDHESLSNLALAADLFSSTSTSHRRGSLIQSYCGSKSRIQREYQVWRGTTFGARLEVRLSGGVIASLRRRLEDPDERLGRRPTRLRATPAFLWCVSTPTWCSFMRGNFHKITSVIEMIILSNHHEGIERDSSELVYALFLYLQGFSNSNAAKTPLLWKQTQDHHGHDLLGLDLGHNMSTYGFGWIAPLVDWQGLRLLPHARRQLIGCHEVIGVNYRRRMHLLQDQRAILELCHQHIRSAARGSPLSEAALNTAAHFVIRQYRRDVLGRLALKRELNAGYGTDDVIDGVMFCDAGLRMALVQQPYYVAKNKVLGLHNADEIFDLIMGVDTHCRSRKSFDGPQQKDWRKMLFTMDQVHGGDFSLKQRWRYHLRHEFKSRIWSFPYPDPAGSFLETHSKTGQRKFYAAGEINGVWRCLEHHPRAGMPKPYPKILGMSLEEVGVYFNSLAAPIHRNISC